MVYPSLCSVLSVLIPLFPRDPIIGIGATGAFFSPSSSIQTFMLMLKHSIDCTAVLAITNYSIVILFVHSFVYVSYFYTFFSIFYSFLFFVYVPQFLHSSHSHLLQIFASTRPFVHTRAVYCILCLTLNSLLYICLSSPPPYSRATFKIFLTPILSHGIT